MSSYQQHTKITYPTTRSKDMEYIKLLIIRTLGNFLVFTSIFIIVKTFGPALYQEVKYTIRSLRQPKILIQTTPSTSSAISSRPLNAFGELIASFVSSEEIIIPKDPNFSIVVPKISANENIITNVDSANFQEYSNALRYGVAHAKGTALPGDGAHIYLFAHSTDTIFNVGTYNAVFYLLYKLEQNDDILLFYKGKKYSYKVIDKKIVDPDKVEYLTRQSSHEFLTLQTCWPPGTTLKRLLIFAVPVIE